MQAWRGPRERDRLFSHGGAFSPPLGLLPPTPFSPLIGHLPDIRKDSLERLSARDSL